MYFSPFSWSTFTLSAAFISFIHHTICITNSRCTRYSFLLFTTLSASQFSLYAVFISFIHHTICITNSRCTQHSFLLFTTLSASPILAVHGIHFFYSPHYLHHNSRCTRHSFLLFTTLFASPILAVRGIHFFYSPHYLHHQFSLYAAFISFIHHTICITNSRCTRHSFLLFTTLSASPILAVRGIHFFYSPNYLHHQFSLYAACSTEYSLSVTSSKEHHYLFPMKFIPGKKS